MPRVKDLLHADRIYRLMDSGIPYKHAVRMDKESAELLIEAWDIAMEGQCDHGDDEGGIVLMIGHPE